MGQHLTWKYSPHLLSQLEMALTLDTLAQDLLQQAWKQYHVSDTPFKPEGS